MNSLPLYPENKIPLFDPDAPEQVPRLDPYLLEGEGRPCVIICPGGAYWGLADHEGGPVAEWLNKRGVSAFVLRYRCMPYRYPCQLYDVRRAVKTVKSHADEFGIDPCKVLLMGFSAGGHCAAMGGTFPAPADPENSDPVEQESSEAAGMILCYPVISMTDHCHEDSALNLTNGDQALREKLSIEKSAHKGMPPLFLWHTFDDDAVPVANSLNLALAYEKLGLDCEMHVYPKGHHGIGLAEDFPHVRGWTAELHRWLVQHGFAEDIDHRKEFER